MSANMNDRMRLWLETELGEDPGALAAFDLNYLMRWYLGISNQPTVNLQDTIASDAEWSGLGGDDLYAFFEV